MSKKSDSTKKNEYLNVYARYSGLVLQMIVLVLLGAWGGQTLDKIFVNNFPVFTVLLILLTAFAALLLLFRTILKK